MRFTSLLRRSKWLLTESIRCQLSVRGNRSMESKSASAEGKSSRSHGPAKMTKASLGMEASPLLVRLGRIHKFQDMFDHCCLVYVCQAYRGWQGHRLGIKFFGYLYMVCLFLMVHRE